MDIPALSIAAHQVDLQNRVSIELMSKTLDMAEENGENLIKMMERSVNPHIGGNIDVSI